MSTAKDLQVSTSHAPATTASPIIRLTILQGTFKGGRRRGWQRKCWTDGVKEWTSLSDRPAYNGLTQKKSGRKFPRNRPTRPPDDIVGQGTEMSWTTTIGSITSGQKPRLKSRMYAIGVASEIVQNLLDLCLLLSKQKFDSSHWGCIPKMKWMTSHGVCCHGASGARLQSDDLF